MTVVLGGPASPWLLDVAVCGICSALVSRSDDGELRHLRAHERAGQLGGQR